MTSRSDDLFLLEFAVACIAIERVIIQYWCSLGHRCSIWNLVARCFPLSWWASAYRFLAVRFPMKLFAVVFLGVSVLVPAGFAHAVTPEEVRTRLFQQPAPQSSQP